MAEPAIIGCNLLETLIVILVVIFIAYEFIEHVAFPLIWSLAQRRKKSFSGPERIVSQVGEVIKWDRREGYIFVGGELWKAVSEFPLKVGNKVIIQKVEGLTLTVSVVVPNEKKY
jgi:membrane-bound serine protease (ClpP class)